jgi:hypothetical protein
MALAQRTIIIHELRCKVTCVNYHFVLLQEMCREYIMRHPPFFHLQSIFLDLSFVYWFVHYNIWSMSPQVVHSMGPPTGHALITLNQSNKAFTVLPSSTDVVAFSRSACIAVDTMCPLSLNQWTQPSQDN